MKVEVYFTKKGSELSVVELSPNGREEFEKNYVKVWGGEANELINTFDLLERIYNMFNSDRNPLSDSDSQKILKRKSVSHTSMMVGDIISVDDTDVTGDKSKRYYIADDVGFSDITDYVR